MATYQVELAVCYEDNTWKLYNVPVEAKRPLSGRKALELGEKALRWHYPNLNYVSVGFYHYIDSEADK